MPTITEGAIVPAVPFPQPVPPPALGVLGPATITIHDAAWLPYIIGACKVLVANSTFDPPDPLPALAAVKDAYNLFDDLAAGLTPQQKLITLTPRAADFEDDMTQLRQDPANPCHLQVMCPDGTWDTWADISLCAPNPAPGNNPPLLPPGQPVKVCMTVDADTLTPLPWAVSTGDTLLFEGVTGAGTDGASAGWYCPDGEIYFLGVCAGGGNFVATDPRPDRQHMSLLMKLGTTYLGPFGLVTIPSGVSNVQPYIQVNTNNVSIARGKYQFCVTYTNNQAPPVLPGQQFLNFKASGNGFSGVFSDCAGYNTDWVPENGWCFSNNGAGGLSCGVFWRKIDNACHITGITVGYNYGTDPNTAHLVEEIGNAPGGFDDQGDNLNPIASGTSGAWVTGGWPRDIAAGHYLTIRILNPVNNHSFCVQNLTISFAGTQPFN